MKMQNCSFECIRNDMSKYCPLLSEYRLLSDRFVVEPVEVKIFDVLSPQTTSLLTAIRAVMAIRKYEPP